ncbi:hypothetical protein [Melittangium boletus]|uniref:Uncharacterized protein n=1 Tax=Melittangium boletus DSM 14713 TaxID=1294270 RepID=A0A250IDB8_9BACT|nr:hypothetical protein [Melittangium boletus]ATB29839.1 hypothetical protein MEBOL_003294 [Melittangium boletus DSM 14713]
MFHSLDPFPLHPSPPSSTKLSPRPPRRGEFEPAPSEEGHPPESLDEQVREVLADLHQILKDLDAEESLREVRMSAEPLDAQVREVLADLHQLMADLG